MKLLGILVDRVEPKKAKVLVDDGLFQEGFPVLNAMVYIPFVRKNIECFAIGFINNFYHLNTLYEELELSKNLKHLSEHPVINSMVTRKNFLIADVEIVSAFTYDWERVSLDSAIKIGTQVYKMEDQNFFLNTKKRFNYLGTFYGEVIPQPLYLSDFQEMGEAYHFCIAGQTGSGKSTLAKMLLTLYASSSPSMNFIIIDPVGEFTNNFTNPERDKFGLDMKQIWSQLGRTVEIYNLNNTHFDRWELFKRLLYKKRIFEQIRIKSHEKQMDAIERLENKLKADGVTLSNLCNEKDKILNIITNPLFVKQIYASDKDVERVLFASHDKTFVDNFWNSFQTVASYFAPKSENEKGIDSILRTIGYKTGRTIIFDLSSLSLGEEDIKILLVHEICQTLYQTSLDLYKQRNGVNLNTLVVLDEAHNFAPASYLLKDKDDDLRRTSETIAKAFIETRKFGLGWMVISTRIGNLEKKLYEHSRVKILGFGLHTGSDRDLILETFGRDIIHRYSILSDPTDPLCAKKEVAFLIDGPITVLSRNTPEFVKIFDNVDDFLNCNNLVSSF